MEIFISIMEIYELKYFLAVAREENVNRAAEQIHVSAGSLSKAISRLEKELGTVLFYRVGRGIRLTPEGHLLKQRATDIVNMEEDVRLELKGSATDSLNIYISSEEILQTSFGVTVSQKIRQIFPQAKVHFLIRPENQAIQQVMNGEAHLAIITQEPPQQFHAKDLTEVEFVTCASKKHPLLKRRKGSYSIKQVLEYPFVSPDTAILGRIEKSDSIDGWRDDKFPRTIKYKVCGLKLIENLVQEGLALAYLPDHFVASAGLSPVKIHDCPYSCRQRVKVVAKDPDGLHWLSRLWERI